MKKEAGQVFPPPFFPLTGDPAGLTEGDQPVVCWPAYISRQPEKSSGKAQKVARICVENMAAFASALSYAQTFYP